MLKMTIEQFIESISTIPYRSLEKEFDFARKNQALVTPHLLSILEEFFFVFISGVACYLPPAIFQNFPKISVGCMLHVRPLLLSTVLQLMCSCIG